MRGGDDNHGQEEWIRKRKTAQDAAATRVITGQRFSSKNFRTHPDLYFRESDAPANYVGAFHFGKSLQHYLNEAAAADQVLDTLFEDTQHLWSKFFRWFSREAEKSDSVFRAAEYENQKASRFVMRSWQGCGDYALKPHEDAAQCKAPEQSDFEIQKAADNAIVACNVCIENSPGGNLHYWNIIPDDASRLELEISVTGSPYPLDMLTDIDKQVVRIGVGDIYCFNGKAVHAVEALADHRKSRSTISFLMARRDKNTIIHWT